LNEAVAFLRRLVNNLTAWHCMEAVRVRVLAMEPPAV
jgi:hypothetical protein